jgi:hypothetical protein
MCGTSFRRHGSALGPRAQVAAALSVLVPVALSGVALMVFVTPLWWIFTTYGWVAFPAAGMLVRGLAGVGGARPPLGASERAAALASPGSAGRARDEAPFRGTPPLGRQSGLRGLPELPSGVRRELEGLVDRGMSFGLVVYSAPRPGAQILPGGPGDVERAVSVLKRDPRAGWYWCDPNGVEELGYHEFEPRLEAWSLRARTDAARK